MTKKKNYKKFHKNAFEDKINNVVLTMKFLNSKGGVELVEDFFGKFLPDQALEYEGTGDAKKWVLRQVLRAGHLGYMRRVLSEGQKAAEFIFPLDNYELLEESEEKSVTKVNCDYVKKLRKQGKKFECEFDIKDYYCNHACIPLLLRSYKDIYLDLDVELIDTGCIQTIKVDESTFKKDEKEKKGAT